MLIFSKDEQDIILKRKKQINSGFGLWEVKG
jgi:hypothetical protein